MPPFLLAQFWLIRFDLWQHTSHYQKLVNILVDDDNSKTSWHRISTNPSPVSYESSKYEFNRPTETAADLPTMWVIHPVYIDLLWLFGKLPTVTVYLHVCRITKLNGKLKDDTCWRCRILRHESSCERLVNESVMKNKNV